MKEPEVSIFFREIMPEKKKSYPERLHDCFVEARYTPRGEVSALETFVALLIDDIIMEERHKFSKVHNDECRNEFMKDARVWGSIGDHMQKKHPKAKFFGTFTDDDGDDACQICGEKL